jgi:Transposase DDE domain.
MFIDLDSTHSDTYGKQEDSAFNTHYQAEGYHPLIAFDILSGMLLGARLRPGNQYTSKAAENFLEPFLKSFRNLDLLVRADSGFAKLEIYTTCEQYNAKFVIRLKGNVKLQRLAEQAIRVGAPGEDFTQSEVQWHLLKNYRSDTWKHAYPVIIKSTRSAGAFIFNHEFIVTNLKKTYLNDVFELYYQRGTMEDLIKEIKQGFDLDKTDSATFSANQFRMLIAGIAYNIIQALKELTLPAELKHATIATLRFKLFHVAG